MRLKIRAVVLFLSFVLILSTTLAIAASATYTPVTLDDVLEAADSASSLTLEWYGTMDGITYTDSIDINLIPDGVKDSLVLYKAFREGNFLKHGADSIALQRGLFAFYDVRAALDDYNARALQIDAMEERMMIAITSANVTLSVSDLFVNGDCLQLTVGEWIFYDYDDTEVDGIAVDVSGYGISHKMSFVKSGSYWLISADEYTDDMLTVIEEDTTDGDTLLDGGIRQAGISAIGGNLSQTAKYTRYAAYNPEAAVAYSDSWVYTGATLSTSANYPSYYNPAYYNFNSLGGDCANFTSQSIYAGGMPQVVGTAYGMDGWYYKTSSDRSASWTGAAQLRTWMGNNRGAMVTATASSTWMGCPVFVDWTSNGSYDHAYFCVGLNSSGTPIINSHNYDKYHVKYNYGSSSASYSTVQLTTSNYAIKKTVTAPTLSVASTAAYGSTISVSWGAVTNATSYSYKAVMWMGEVNVTSSSTVSSGTTTSTSFSVPAQTNGKYVVVTVTAVGPDNTASSSATVMIGPWVGYPTDIQYIPINEINGSVSVSNSVIWTSSKGTAFAATYWAAALCTPNSDGSYTVSAKYEYGATKSVTISGNDILIATHSQYTNFEYTANLAVGNKIELCGVYLYTNTLRGNCYVKVNGGIPLVVHPTSLSLKSGTTASASGEYLMGVVTSTTASSLKAMFNEDASYITIKDDKGAAVTDTFIVGTGYTVNLVVEGSVKQTYKVVVKGDITGDGIVSSNDYVALAKHLNNTVVLSDICQKAGDYDSSGELSTADYIVLKNMLSGN